MARTAKKVEAPYKLVDSVQLGRIFLALHNPRFEPVETEAEAIDRLVNKEDVVPLARDIVRHGLSPLERFALTRVGKTRGGEATYWVDEGNRRVCALKLLVDPDLAPPRYRNTFEKLAAEWTPITAVPAVVFYDQDTLRLWLDRTHSGPQGGVGRKDWNADQKQRFSGSSKNKLAQAILDYAEAEKMITKEERQGKLTTAQRFLTPEAFQETLGIDQSNPDELQRTRPKAEFDAMLKRFMRDLVDGEEVTSRKNKQQIIEYARTLGTLPGVTTARVDPEPFGAGGGTPKKRARRKPKTPEKARHIQYEEDIYQALRALENEKLQSLYYSICSLELEKHAPLASIGVWAFFETLTAGQGRKDGTDISSFLQKSKLQAMGFGVGTHSLRQAIERIRDYGNTTKHHSIAAAFNGEQLNNDMKALKEVILKCIEEAAANR